MDLKPKSKKFDVCITLLIILSILTAGLIFLGCFLNAKTLKVYAMFLLIAIFIFSVSYIILICVHDKELKRLTDSSFVYYKYNLHQFTYLPIIFCLAFTLALLVFIFCPNVVSTSTITSINISLFSLLFAIFIFIIPRCKANLEKKKQLATKTTYSDESEVKKSMGKIYKENQDYNSLAYIMTLTAIIFCISILSILIFGSVLFTQFVLYFSNIICMYFIIKLLTVVNHDLLSDLDKLEKQLLKVEEETIRKLNQDESE